MNILLFKELKALGAEVELADNPLGNQKLPDGTEIPLPPILLGILGNDPKKHTVSISLFLIIHSFILSFIHLSKL